MGSSVPAAITLEICINDAAGRLAETVIRRLLDRSRGIGTTLHRAFDLVPDMSEALDLAIALGFDRVLCAAVTNQANGAPS